MELNSDHLANAQGCSTNHYRVSYFFKPFGNEAAGGDRFTVYSDSKQRLFFYIADATGHGSMGARFWNSYRSSFDLLWQRWINDELSMEEFMKQFNDVLSESKNEFSQICLALGVIDSSQLHFANFGYGTHVLIQTTNGSWWASPKDMFGLKLGWVNSQEWSRIPRAFVDNKVVDITRLVLMTDSFLGDDFKDPEATMEQVAQMNQHCHSLGHKEIIPYFLTNFSYQNDDTAVVVIDIA